MAVKYEILFLDTNPYYTYVMALNKVAYVFTFRYSTRESCWYMDIKTNDNVPVIYSVKLVPNYPLLDGLNLSTLTGDFYLIPIVENNLYKYEEDPENIASYFNLVYVYES